MKSILISLIGIAIMGMPAFVVTEGQSGSVATGGEISSADHTLSFSIGPTFYTSFGNDGFYISSGIQHPEIRIFTRITENEDLKHEIRVFPNPTSDWINIRIKDPDFLDSDIRLISMEGKVLFSKAIENGELNLPVSQLEPGNYTLLIVNKRELLRSFNIIKSK